MMKMPYWALTTLVVGLALAINPAHAQQNVNCANSEILSGTFENVNVPPNTFCELADSVKIQGNITVREGASLDIEFIAVNGSIVANGAGLLVIDGATVGGSVIATGLQIVRINQSGIVGNVVISGSSTLVEIFPNTVNGNVIVSNNNTFGGSTIAANTIGGNLVCAVNTPPPDNFGLTNSVSGQRVGQCAGL